MTISLQDEADVDPNDSTFLQVSIGVISSAVNFTLHKPASCNAIHNNVFWQEVIFLIVFLSSRKVKVAVLVLFTTSTLPFVSFCCPGLPTPNKKPNDDEP